MKISLFYQHVTVLDYAYFDAHKGLIGDALIVDVDFIGHTDHEGVLYDFSYAKKMVKEIIDRDCDHRFLLPEGMLAKQNDLATFEARFGYEDQVLSHKGPLQAYCEIPSKVINKSTIATYLENIILKEMPDTVDAIQITLRDELLPQDAALFHYTHGLKDHYGNCQRLFHGHKNTVEVFVNGKKSSEWEHRLAENLFSGNIHFCLKENIQNWEDVSKGLDSSGEGRLNEVSYVHVKYESSQGAFEAKIPGQMVYVLEDESTIENLSSHFAKIVKSSLNKNDSVTVRAFEGIGKGACTTL